MAPRGERLNIICAEMFFGWTHEGKTKFIIITHGCPISPPRSKIICNAVSTHIFVTTYLAAVIREPWPYRRLMYKPNIS